MSISKTKQLAIELGYLRERRLSQFSKKVCSGSSTTAHQSKPLYQFLIVIDFESTCWPNDSGIKYANEIIEFPAVLMRTSDGLILSEFREYVTPTEHIILSKFCTKLTGITQSQADGGIQLQKCLQRFKAWIQKQMFLHKFLFTQETAPGVDRSELLLACFVTWTDWDLGTCLKEECRRKRLEMPKFLETRLDLKEVYIMFYKQKPRGLSGALSARGLEFIGRPHCGLDDARNTAKLAHQMICNGCLLGNTTGQSNT